MDATKVEYCKLFRKLLNKKLSVVTVRFILNMYIAHKTHVSWNCCTSCWFDVNNGIKQGGVLSHSSVSTCTGALGTTQPNGACGDAFPIERVLVATYLLSAEALPHCRCGVANKGCMVWKRLVLIGWAIVWRQQQGSNQASRYSGASLLTWWWDGGESRGGYLNPVLLWPVGERLFAALYGMMCSIVL